jgi:adenylylsulfate kinase-like enzyme
MVIWLYGQPKSGKTALAELLYINNLNNAMFKTMLFDDEKIKKLYHITDDRVGFLKNGRILAELSKYMDSELYNVIVASNTPYHETRTYLKELLPNSMLVYLEHKTYKDNQIKDFNIPTKKQFDLKVEFSEETINENLAEIVDFRNEFIKSGHIRY